MTARGGTTLLVSEIFPPVHGGSGRWFWEIYRRLPRESYLIVSLLAPESTFATGIERLLARAIAPAVTSTAERSTARESAREIE